MNNLLIHVKAAARLEQLTKNKHNLENALKDTKTHLHKTTLEYCTSADDLNRAEKLLLNSEWAVEYKRVAMSQFPDALEQVCADNFNPVIEVSDEMGEELNVVVPFPGSDFWLYSNRSPQKCLDVLASLKAFRNAI